MSPVRVGDSRITVAIVLHRTASGHGLRFLRVRFTGASKPGDSKVFGLSEK